MRTGAGAAVDGATVEMGAIRSVRRDFDWNSLRFVGEEVLRREVERLPAYPGMLEGEERGTRRPSGVRLRSIQSPSLKAWTETVERVLGLGRRIEAAVFPGQDWSAEGVESEEGGGIVVRLSSAAAATESPREFLFGLGRGVGRVLLDQAPFPRDPSAGCAKGDRQTLLVRGLYRFQEMARDRVGLLACQDVEAAAASIVQSMSGLPPSRLRIRIEDLLGELHDEEEAMISPDEHRFLLLRVAAIWKFAQSDKYAGALGEEVEGPAIATASAPASAEVGLVAEPVAGPESPPAARSDVVSAPIPASAGSAVQFEYVPVGGDPSVVEQVVRCVPPAAPEQGPSGVEGCEPSHTRRNFCVPAAFWILGSKPAISERQREVLLDLYGEGVLDEVRPIYEQGGAQAFERLCRERAADAARLDPAARLDLLRELCRVGMIEEADPSPVRPALSEIAKLLDLSESDVSMALAEYVEPEFATYPFQVGEAVDVHLDGQWLEGVVERVEPGGELRVQFASVGKRLLLHPTADLIRPRERKRVG